ncbi:MAG: HAD-IB family hydrolase [Acidimicrobiales bacterium]
MTTGPDPLDEPVGSTTIAAFDFDGTLSRRDTLLPFLAQVAGAPAVARALSRAVVGSGRSLPRRDLAKETVLRQVLGGRPEAEVRAHGRAFAEAVVSTPRRLNEVAVDRLAWHREQGHRIVIISGSLELYLGEIARRWGAVASGVRLEVVDGILTGRLLGPNVRGPEKLSRLDEALDDPATRVVAYGNSGRDRELLERADEPYLYRRGRFVAYPRTHSA